MLSFLKTKELHKTTPLILTLRPLHKLFFVQEQG